MCQRSRPQNEVETRDENPDLVAPGSLFFPRMQCCPSGTGEISERRETGAHTCPLPLLDRGPCHQRPGVPGARRLTRERGRDATSTQGLPRSQPSHKHCTLFSLGKISIKIITATTKKNHRSDGKKEFT